MSEKKELNKEALQQVAGGSEMFEGSKRDLDRITQNIANDKNNNDTWNPGFFTNNQNDSFVPEYEENDLSSSNNENGIPRG